MARQVKGHLFAEYVRMIRANKEIDWSEVLEPEELSWTTQQIAPEKWYPMEVFEELGLAILDKVGNHDLTLIHRWGRQTIDELKAAHPDLMVDNDPRETFMRFQILRQTLFDFPAVKVTTIRDGKAILEVQYGMSGKAEEAAAHQSLGFLERLLEVSGAREAAAEILEGSWDGFPSTTIAVSWK